MTATVFLHRIDINLIDTVYNYTLDDFDLRKRATGCSSFLVGTRQSVLDVANMVDK